MTRRCQSSAPVLLLAGLLGALAACGPAGEEPAPTAETASKSVGSEAPGETRLADRLESVQPPESYELRSTPPDSGGALTMLFKLEDGQVAKVKMIKSDGWLVLNLLTDDTFAFETEWGHVVKLPLRAAAEGVWADPRDYVDPEARIEGEESIDGERCWIAAAQGPDGSRVWIGAKDGLPRRLETGEGITRFAYSRIDEIEDYEFDLPPTLRVVDLAELVPG